VCERAATRLVDNGFAGERVQFVDGVVAELAADEKAA
jgi:hypothetical protein